MVHLYMKIVGQQKMFSRHRTCFKGFHSLGSQISSQASVSLRRHPPRDRWSLTSISVPFVSNPAKKGCRAQTSAAALVKEFSDSLSLSHSLHSQAIQKHMPVKYRNLWKMYYHMCALKTWEKVLGRKQDRQTMSLPIPGLGALWPRGGWSMSHCEITCNTCSNIVKENEYI